MGNSLGDFYHGFHYFRQADETIGHQLVHLLISRNRKNIHHYIRELRRKFAIIRQKPSSLILY